MRFRKGSLVIENNNPVCDSLYLRQGWVPVEDAPVVIEESVITETSISLTAEQAQVIDEQTEDKTVEVAEETVENSQKDSVDETPIAYKKGDFTTLSKDKIVELAESLGYTITATKKADMIEEFLAQQNK